jgi:hypothetical protein
MLASLVASTSLHTCPKQVPDGTTDDLMGAVEAELRAIRDQYAPQPADTTPEGDQ